MSGPTDPVSGKSSALSSEREFFDRLVDVDKEFDPFTESGWKVVQAAFRKLVEVRKEGDLLDIGCGTGSSLQVYEGCFGTYTGLDLSPSSIAAAQAKFPQHRWIVGDAASLAIADETYDTVAFSSVLHHISDMTPALKEAHRVLKPGGTVFAYDPNLLHPAMALLRHPRSPLYLSAGVSPNERPLMPGTLRRAFEAAGFQSIRQRAQSGIGYRHVAPRGVNACLSAFNLVDQGWNLLVGRWLGTFVLTTAVK